MRSRRCTKPHTQAGRSDNPRVRAAVDLHCHILPGLDDGARDLDDAVAMAQQAQDDGIAAVCATPHIRHDHDVRIVELPARREALRAALRDTGCATRILAGGEVAVSALGGLDNDELAAVALGGGGRWILLEPSPGPLDDDFATAVGTLAARGFRAVVAHPERHGSEDLVVRLRAIVAAGALVQATGAYLTADASRSGMLALARAGVIHVLGSDAHSARAGRPVALAAPLAVLGSVHPAKDHIRWIAQAAPLAIVQGRAITPPF